MTTDPKVLAKVASIFRRMPESEEMAKESANIRTALRATGLVGAAAGGGVFAGSMIGEKKGIKKGREVQLAQDLSKFRTAASNIYNMGRSAGAVELATRIKQRFNHGLTGGLKAKNVSTIPKISTKTIKKASLDKAAESVYQGWLNNNIPIELIRNLPPNDMGKIAAVVLDKMNDGDKVAGILWNLITEA